MKNLEFIFVSITSLDRAWREAVVTFVSGLLGKVKFTPTLQCLSENNTILDAVKQAACYSVMIRNVFHKRYRQFSEYGSLITNSPINITLHVE